MPRAGPQEPPPNPPAGGGRVSRGPPVSSIFPFINPNKYTKSGEKIYLHVFLLCKEKKNSEKRLLTLVLNKQNEINSFSQRAISKYRKHFRFVSLFFASLSLLKIKLEKKILSLKFGKLAVKFVVYYSFDKKLSLFVL